MSDSMAKFMEMTGQDGATATNFLEMAGGDLSTAVSLFMDMGPSAAAAPNPSAAPSQRSKDFGGNAAPPDPYGQGGFGAGRFNGGGFADQDEVRAPDQVKKQRLMDADPHQAAAAYAPSSSRRRGPPVPEPPPQVHAFRDFSREADIAAAQARRKLGLPDQPPPLARGHSHPGAATGAKGKGAKNTASDDAAGKSSVSRSRSSDRASQGASHLHGSTGSSSGDSGGGSAAGSQSSSKANSSSSSTAAEKDASSASAPHNAASNVLEGDKRLADLFRPPMEIMHSGTFAEAKASAAAEGKWLLVNIQRETEFASHQLNRDTWHNETVKCVLESLVVFWQQYDVSPQGSLYVQRYKVNTFPHIALLDPRTGLSRWQKSGFVSAEFMTDKVSDFCGQNSLESDSLLDRPHRTHPRSEPAAASAASAAVNAASAGAAPSSSLSSSLASSSSSSTSSSSSSSSAAAISAAGNDKLTATSSQEPVALPNEPAKPTLPPPPSVEFADIVLSEEPPGAAPGASRIGLKLPPPPSTVGGGGASSKGSGQVVRRFHKDAPLTELFKWAADKLLAQQESLSSSSSASNSSENSAADPSSNSCSGDRPFDIKLVAPPFTSMRAALKAGDEGSGEGATLESAGCCSARLNLEWL